MDRTRVETAALRLLALLVLGASILVATFFIHSTVVRDSCTAPCDPAPPELDGRPLTRISIVAFGILAAAIVWHLARRRGRSARAG